MTSAADLIHGSLFMGLYLIVFILARWIKDWTTPYSLKNELTIKDNPALAISVAGYFLGVTAAFAGVILSPSLDDQWMDLAITSGYAVMGILLLNIARLINDKIILARFSNQKEIIEDRNMGTGVVVAGSYIASGLVIGGALHGETGTILHTLLITISFWALGQVTLVVFGLLYSRITSYDVHDEIEKDNVAAGVSFAGGLVAISILIMKSVSGTFVSIEESMVSFGLDVAMIFVLLLFVRFFFDYVLIPGTNLNHEIVKDRNLGAGILEATILISFALVLVMVV